MANTAGSTYGGSGGDISASAHVAGELSRRMVRLGHIQCCRLISLGFHYLYLTTLDTAVVGARVRQRRQESHTLDHCIRQSRNIH